ncbi:uncharacterized protein METZ01_LOCUS343613, partial [marine metagenome]
MRHRNKKHLLGVKAPHRKALISNLCAALITRGRITTTLAKAKAIRPAVEKMITRAKKAKASDDPAVRLHHRRQCARHLRDKDAAHLLFNEKVDEFVNRAGGYVRIYKLGDVRLGDSAEMAIVELIDAEDEGYPKRRKKKPSKPKASSDQSLTEIKDEEETEKNQSEDQPAGDNSPEDKDAGEATDEIDESSQSAEDDSTPEQPADIEEEDGEEAEETLVQSESDQDQGEELKKSADDSSVEADEDI